MSHNRWDIAYGFLIMPVVCRDEGREWRDHPLEQRGRMGASISSKGLQAAN